MIERYRCDHCGKKEDIEEQDDMPEGWRHVTVSVSDGQKSDVSIDEIVCSIECDHEMVLSAAARIAGAPDTETK